MYIYKDLDQYFNPCTNCGECCKIPGQFLPSQIVTLAEHLKMDIDQLFNRYLIAELCAPDDTTSPVFVLSPVKVDEGGNRFPVRFMDMDYTTILDKYCIFRDNERGTCVINKVKPFACGLLLCPKMTLDKSLSLDKSYYFHKWKDRQDIIFSIFPELRDISERLRSSVNWMAKTRKLRNNIICTEIARVMNGIPTRRARIFK
jgi:Fe-S-cluster containining protein